MAEQRTELSREMSLFTLTMVGVGAMIGAGIFVLTGEAAGIAGPALVLSFALNGVISLLTAMTYAELGSAIPEAGGGYLWIKEGLPGGNAFLAGWMSWFAHAVAGALYALGFGSFLFELLRIWSVPWESLGVELGLAKKVFGVGIALAFAYVNFRGASETGLAGNIVTLAKLGVIAVFCFFGLKFMFAPELAFTVGAGGAGGAGLDHLRPLIPDETGWLGILSAMGLTFIAFEGYEIIVQAGEEVEDPRRNVPKAVFWSLAIVIPVYMLVAFVLVGATSAPRLWATLQEMGMAVPEGMGADAANWELLRHLGELGLARAAAQFIPYGAVLILLGGVLSTMSALNATTYSSTRVSFAMGRDRNLPDAFGRVHEANHTPHVALFWTAVIIVLMVVFVPITTVAAAADIMFLLLFLQVNVVVLRIRRQYGRSLAYGFLMPFIVPTTILAIVTKLGLAVVLVDHYPMAWVYALAWIGVGFAVWRLYGRQRRTEAEEAEELEERAPVVSERAPVEARPHSVLVAVERSRPDAELVRLGGRIAAGLDSEVVLLHAVPVPRQLPLRAGQRFADRARDMLERARELAAEAGAPVRTVVRLARHTSQAVLRAAGERQADFLLLGWRPDRHRRFRLNGVGRVLRRSKCHAVVSEAGAPGADGALERTVDQPLRVLVALSDPATAPLAVGVAATLAGDGRPGRVTVLHLTDDPPSDSDLAAFRRSIEDAMAAQHEGEPEALFGEGSPLTVDVRRVESGVAEDLAVLSEDYDRLVAGLHTRGLFGRRTVSRTAAEIAHRARCPVVLVRPEESAVLFGIQRFFEYFRVEGEEQQDGAAGGEPEGGDGDSDSDSDSDDSDTDTDGRKEA